MKRFLFLILIITISVTGFAQWQQTSCPSVGLIQVNCCGFGNIHFKNGTLWAGRDNLFKSVDSGANWVALPKTYTGVITEINFFDVNIGVMSTTTGIYRTVDGGTTWTKILNSGDCYSVQHAGSANNIVGVSDAGTPGLYYSNNGGSSWSRSNLGSHKLCVLGNKDGSAYALSGFGNANIYYTTNSGATWPIKSTIDYDSFSFAQDSSSYIFLMNEEGHVTSDSKASFCRSNDGGVTWQKMTSFTPQYYTGGIAVAKCVVFAHTINNGVLRSLDKGATWTSIGGPNCNIDTRLICAISNNIVLAADANGNIWRTLNSGGVQMADEDPKLIGEFPPSKVVSVCDATDFLSKFHINSTCTGHKLYITSETITGPFAQFFAITSRNPPFVVTDAADENVTVTFTPFDTSGSFTGGLRIQGYYSDGLGDDIPFDIIIDLNAIVTPEPPKISASGNAVTFPTRTPCSNPHDTIITLTNIGCDTLKILSGPGNAPAGFKYDPLTYPIILAPGEQIDVHFYFDPQSPGNYTMDGVFLTESNKLQMSVPITLLGARESSRPIVHAKDSLIAFRSTTVCDALRDSLIVLTNTGCDTLRITSLPDNIGNEFSLDSVSLPIILAPGESTTLVVHFHPSVPGLYDTTIVVSLESHGLTGKYTIVLSGKNTAVRPQITGSLSTVSFDTLSTCDGMLDTTLVLHNMGCDTLRIISGPGGLPPEYTIDDITLPIILPPDSSITITLHFKPTSAGRFVATPLFTAERFGLTTNYTFFVEGTGEEGTGELTTTPPEFTFPVRSICSGADSLRGSITNTGCDTLVLDDASLAGDGVFTKTSVVTPTRLAKGETLYYTIYFTPGTKGQHSGAMTITAHTAHGSMTSTTHIIHVKGGTSDGTRTLTLKPTAIDFGTTTVCEERDSIVALYNSGCDTLTISNVTSLGLGFITGVTTPIILPPGDSAFISIKTSLDTSGMNPLSSGSFTVSSDADNTVPSVTYARGYIYPKRYSLSVASPSLGATAGDTTSFVVSVNAPLQNIKTVDMTFNYNTDLLEYIYASSDNNVTLTGNKLRISGNPYITSSGGVLSTLYFRVYLTKDSTSALALSSVLLDEIDPATAPCAPSATIGGGGSFNYIFNCGERSIAGYMNGKMPLSINSLRPNPASGDVQITLTASIATDYRIRVTDALGKTVITSSDHITQGAHTLSLQTESLASGVYLIKVSTPLGEDQVEFMKVK